MATATKKKTAKKKTAKKAAATKKEESNKDARGRSDVVASPVVRASFPYVHKPDSGGQYSKDNYKITGFIEKDREAELKPLKMACMQAAKQVWPSVKFDDLEHPFRDGDDSNTECYQGCMYFTAKSSRKPGVVGPDLHGLPEGVEIYGGCYVRISLSAFTYTRTGEVIVEKDGKRFKKKETIKGVSFGLQNVQFVKDGERLGGGSSPQQDFEEIDPSEYDELDEDETFDEPDAEEEELEEADEDDEII